MARGLTRRLGEPQGRAARRSPAAAFEKFGAAHEPFRLPVQPMQQEGRSWLMSRRSQGGLDMSVYKVLSAIAAAALGAAVVMALPGFSPNVEAGTSNPVTKTDRLDHRPLGSDCTQQAWPYYDAGCLRDRTQASGQARVVRLVTTDRLPR